MVRQVLNESGKWQANNNGQVRGERHSKFYFGQDHYEAAIPTGLL